MVKKRTKVCQFCKASIDEMDYKEIGRIRRFTSSRGKILSVKVTGTCAKHQRMLSKTIKRARFLGMLPYVKI